MNPKLSHPELTAQRIVTTWVAEGGIHNMDWAILCERITEALKASKQPAGQRGKSACARWRRT